MLRSLLVIALSLAGPVLLSGDGSKPTGYVGSKACYGCHSAIYNTYAKTAMGQSMRGASELDQLGLPRDATLPAPRDGAFLRAWRDERGWLQSENLPGVFVDEHKIDYAIGSGVNGFSFIVQRDGGLFQAPLSYYSRTGKWDLSPGYEHSDIGFGRPIAEQCLVCHTGRVRASQESHGQYLDPPFQELAIGCENCHGPAQAHVQNSKALGLIVNPAKLPARLAEDICITCHQRGDARVLQPGRTYLDFRPGQWLFQTLAVFKVPTKPAEQAESDLLEHNSAMKASRCFVESKGKLSCLTCHDPHVQPKQEETSAYFRAKCFTCHTDASCKLSKMKRAAYGSPEDCIGCHMPKRDVAGIAHSALTNHRVPASPDEKFPLVTPSAEAGLVVVNPPADHKPIVPEITLLRAYAEVSSQHPEFQASYLELLKHLAESKPLDPMVQAALGHKALAGGENDVAIGHLSKALSLREATVYVDLAKALSSAGRDHEASDALRKAYELEPYDYTILKKLILANIQLKRYREAQQLMEKYVSLLPEDSFMRDLLARVTAK